MSSIDRWVPQCEEDYAVVSGVHHSGNHSRVSAVLATHHTPVNPFRGSKGDYLSGQRIQGGVHLGQTGGGVCGGGGRLNQPFLQTLTQI